VTIRTRSATTADFPHLAQFRIMAHGGFNEAIYAGLVPGQSIENIIQPEFAEPDSTYFYENHWIASWDDQIAGGLHVYSWDDMANDPLNPLIPKERYALEEPFHLLTAPGTYYIHALAVYPEFGRRGIGSCLLSLARDQAAEKGFTDLSLYVFAQNVGAVELYEKHGYRVAGRSPVVEHPLLRYTGDVLIMTCPV
jgi:ribosomal protein S18 acetylase RimI-like enzyme